MPPDRVQVDSQEALMFTTKTDFTALSDAELIEAFHLIDEECRWADALCAELKRRGIEV